MRDVQDEPQTRSSTRCSRAEEVAFEAHFAHSVRLDVGARCSALDGQQLLVVEGSGVAGTCSGVEQDISDTPCPHHHHPSPSPPSLILFPSPPPLPPPSSLPLRVAILLPATIYPFDRIIHIPVCGCVCGFVCGRVRGCAVAVCVSMGVCVCVRHRWQSRQSWHNWQHGQNWQNL